MLEKTKGQGGITLVALVVTIVVLLILAGITIALVFSQDGVINKAQTAANNSNMGTIADNIQGFIVGKQIEVLADSSKAGDITSALKTALETAGITVDTTTGTGTVSVGANTKVTITGTIKFTLGGQSYNLTSKGYDTGYPTLTPVNP